MTTKRDKQKQERLVQRYQTDRPEISWMAFWRRLLEDRKAKQDQAPTEHNDPVKRTDAPQQSESEEQSDPPPKRRVIRINRQQLLMTLSVLAFMAWWQLYLRTL